MTLATLGVVAAVAKLRHPRPPQPSVNSTLPKASSAGGLAASSVPDAGGARAPRTLHGDARRTHRAAAIGPRAATLGWKVTLGGPVEAQVVASPDEAVLYAASLDGRVHAIGRDGKERWSVDLGDRAYATPLVGDDGTIYAGSDAKKLVAITPEGSVRWRLELRGEIDTGVAQAADGSLVVVSGADVCGVTKDGALTWRFSAKKKIFTAPALHADGSGDDWMVFGSQDHNTYGLSARGQLRFATDLGADVDGSPVIADDGAIYVGTDAGDVVKLAPTGAIAWRANLGGFVRGPLSIARDGDVLAGVYGPTPKQARVSPEGALRGALAIEGTGAKEFGVHGGALEDAAGTLYFGAQDDALYAVDRDGRVLFRFTAEADIDAPATLLSDGSLVFAADDGTVYYLRP